MGQVKAALLSLTIVTAVIAGLTVFLSGAGTRAAIGSAPNPATAVLGFFDCDQMVGAYIVRSDGTVVYYPHPFHGLEELTLAIPPAHRYGLRHCPEPSNPTL